MFPLRKPLPQQQRTLTQEKPKERSCRRIIKRDEQGRIKEERFEGDCSKAQMEAFVGRIGKEDDD